MRKNLILAVLAIISFSSAYCADGKLTTYFSCDFSEGLPAGTTVKDADGAELHFLMKQAGFKQGDSWKVINDRQSMNHYIGSPSMHKTEKDVPPIPACDYLTLPPILIRGKEATVKWKARSINEQSNTSASTYTILVNGEELLAKTEAPVTGWTEMSADLNDYAGQNVSITFVNNSLNGEILAIDDIIIQGDGGIASVEVLPGETLLGEKSFRIGVKVTAISKEETINSVGLTCSIGEEILRAEAKDLNLTFGGEHTLMIDREFSGNYGDSFTYTLTPEINSTSYDPQIITTLLLPFRPKKRTVLEETTGQWCGWCPLGIVAIDSLHMAFGDDVIPIAIHIGDDRMAFDKYAEAVKLGGGAAPVGYFDREVYNSNPLQLLKVGVEESYTVWHGGFATDAEKQLAKLPMAEIDAEAIFLDDKTIKVNTRTRTIKDLNDAGYRIALTLVEDDVWRPGYFQTNYLANYPDRAPVGDFCSLPSKITNGMKFHHVARDVAEKAYSGIPESLPADMTAGETYPFEYVWSMPSNILNPKALKVVAMVVDKENHIVNATQVALDPSFSSLKDADADITTERVTTMNGEVHIESVGIIDAALIDLSGCIIDSANATDTVTLRALPGIYLLRIGNRTLKICL